MNFVNFWILRITPSILLSIVLLSGCDIEATGDDDDMGDDDTVAPDDDDTGGLDDDDTGPGDDDTTPPPQQCFPAGQPVCPPASDTRPEDDYYDDIDSQSPYLANDLYQLIRDPNTIGYDSLWHAFEDTDADAAGNVWDIYSDVPGGNDPYTYDFNDQCGQYGGEGDCYNREHSWPSSWSNEDSTMKSDLFHVYPTDGYVNNRRSNWPLGVVGDVDWAAANGSLLGECEHQGQTQTVFEPIDEYKGDLARTYFYVSVAYTGNGWSSNIMVQGASLTDAAEAMLRQWHEDDPVSAKEIDRNDEVQDRQGNRNPFIDHPEWVCLIDDF
jgi:endonuclease I